MSWSMNWPHAQPHCEMLFSEKRFWPTSLKMRLLTYRGDGPETIWAIPSAYFGDATRRYRVPACPHPG
jgi:hypothetical protein